LTLNVRSPSYPADVLAFFTKFEWTNNEKNALILKSHNNFKKMISGVLSPRLEGKQFQTSKDEAREVDFDLQDDLIDQEDLGQLQKTEVTEKEAFLNLLAELPNEENKRFLLEELRMMSGNLQEEIKFKDISSIADLVLSENYQAIPFKEFVNLFVDHMKPGEQEKLVILILTQVGIKPIFKYYTDIDCVFIKIQAKVKCIRYALNLASKHYEEDIEATLVENIFWLLFNKKPYHKYEVKELIDLSEILIKALDIEQISYEASETLDYLIQAYGQERFLKEVEKSLINKGTSWHRLIEWINESDRLKTDKEHVGNSFNSAKNQYFLKDNTFNKDSEDTDLINQRLREIEQNSEAFRRQMKNNVLMEEKQEESQLGYGQYPGSKGSSAENSYVKRRNNYLIEKKENQFTLDQQGRKASQGGYEGNNSGEEQNEWDHPHKHQPHANELQKPSEAHLFRLDEHFRSPFEFHNESISNSSYEPKVKEMKIDFPKHKDSIEDTPIFGNKIRNADFFEGIKSPESNLMERENGVGGLHMGTNGPSTIKPNHNYSTDQKEDYKDVIDYNELQKRFQETNQILDNLKFKKERESSVRQDLGKQMESESSVRRKQNDISESNRGEDYSFRLKYEKEKKNHMETVLALQEANTNYQRKEDELENKAKQVERLAKEKKTLEIELQEMQTRIKDLEAQVKKVGSKGASLDIFANQPATDKISDLLEEYKRCESSKQQEETLARLIEYSLEEGGNARGVESFLMHAHVASSSFIAQFKETLGQLGSMKGVNQASFQGMLLFAFKMQMGSAAGDNVNSIINILLTTQNIDTTINSLLIALRDELPAMDKKYSSGKFTGKPETVSLGKMITRTLITLINYCLNGKQYNSTFETLKQQFKFFLSHPPDRLNVTRSAYPGISAFNR
jgi:hypothetical protein